MLILGAGLSGLAVAYELGKVGYDCRILEARSRPGRCFTVALRILIRNAYALNLERFTLISGPFARLIGSAPGMRREDVLRFDVQGKPPENSQPQERRASYARYSRIASSCAYTRKCARCPSMRSPSPGPTASGRT